jgi:hypothetical protein
MSSDIIDSNTIHAIREWMETCRGGDVAFVRGANPGMGITTLLHTILDEIFETIWISTGQPKLKHVLTDAASSTITPLMRRKIIVFDPVDALFADTSASVDIAEFVRRGSKLPILCAGFRMRFSATRATDIFDKRKYTITRIEVPPLDRNVALRHLHVVARTHGFPESSVLSVWDEAQGDLRSATSAIQAGLPHATKDEVCDGVEAIARILTSRTLSMRDAMELQDGDTSVVSMGVFENYHRVVDSIDACAQMTELFSRADVVDEAIYGRQRWELCGTYTALTAAGPSALVKCQGGPEREISIEKYGSVWSRGNNQKSKENVLLAISHQCMAHGCTNLSASDLAYVRGMLMGLASNGQYASMASLISDVFDEQGVLGIIRMFRSKKYTQTDHTKYKRAAASCEK